MANILEWQSSELFDFVFVFEALLMFFTSNEQEKFINALLSRLDFGGRLVLTGIRQKGSTLPTELRWVADYLRGFGLTVEVGRFLPTQVSWAPQPDSDELFPMILADK